MSAVNGRAVVVESVAVMLNDTPIGSSTVSTSTRTGTISVRCTPRQSPVIASPSQRGTGRISTAVGGGRVIRLDFSMEEDGPVWPRTIVADAGTGRVVVSPPQIAVTAKPRLGGAIAGTGNSSGRVVYFGGTVGDIRSIRARTIGARSYGTGAIRVIPAQQSVVTNPHLGIARLPTRRGVWIVVGLVSSMNYYAPIGASTVLANSIYAARGILVGTAQYPVATNSRLDVVGI